MGTWGDRQSGKKYTDKNLGKQTDRQAPLPEGKKPRLEAGKGHNEIDRRTGAGGKIHVDVIGESKGPMHYGLKMQCAPVSKKNLYVFKNF